MTIDPEGAHHGAEGHVPELVEQDEAQDEDEPGVREELPEGGPHDVLEGSDSSQRTWP